MRKSRFTESQIISILAQQEQGMKVSQICREHGISIPTFHNWKSKYSGMDVNQLRKLKELEAEHGRLKKMYAELSLVHHALKDAMEKKL
ncbi:transposase [Roseivirga sp. UBA1976]|mgnify:CR=1 FL=1|uniref:transposase n=1 Tax=Roseivirga sp. UBA1976 TaxID=1947386 RepID=UPI00257E4B74|nr:transposase [Roseivirga sp. UBA1976]|tara:strand:+ start:7826 stop:8092 length:267 start_codon:yes stop_codon:yes gene_type:complete